MATNNTGFVSNDFDLRRKKVDRQRQMAQLLQQQAMTPDQGQMVSGHYVAPNPMQGVAKLLMAYNAKTGMDDADAQEQDLNRQYKEALATGLQNYQKALQGEPEQQVESKALINPDGTPKMVTVPGTPGDKQKALAHLLQSEHPMLQEFGMKQMMAGPAEYSTTPQYDQSGRAFVMNKEGGVKYLDGIQARDKKEIAPSGVAYNPYQIESGQVFNDPNKMMNIGPDGQPVVNQPLVAAKKDIAKSGASNLNVGTGSGKYADKRQEGRATAMAELEKSAENSYKQIIALDRFSEASKNGTEGGAQPIITAVQGFISSFGYTPESLKNVRVMEQAIGDILGSKMAELGARGLTDQDMKILREALPRVATDRESREIVAGILRKSHESTLAEYHNMRQEEARIHPDLSAQMPEQVWYKDYKARQEKGPSNSGGNVIDFGSLK